MQSVPTQLQAAFRRAIYAAFGMDADPLIGVSQNPQFGDYQSNVAMGLAKGISGKTAQKSNPRAVAEQIKANLNLEEFASEISIAGPGFINVRLKPAWVSKTLAALTSDNRLGVESAIAPQTVVVDYSGPNIAKQMHVGHLRSTIIGDAISRVIEFQSNTVIRQNHIGDWGTQFGMLIQRKLEIDSQIGQLNDLEDEYRAAKQRFDESPEFQKASRQRVVELQAGDESIRNVWTIIVDETRRHYQPLYTRMNVALRRQHERGESFYNPVLSEVVKDLLAKNIAVESDGAVVVFIDGADKSPLVIQKSDGGYLYGTTDLAAIRYRVDELHAQRIIYTHDHRQAQHFSQVFRTAQLAGWAPKDKVQLEYAPFGTMLGEDSKPFKTRSGDTVKLVDLLDEAEERALAVVAQKNAGLDAGQQEQIAHSVGIGAVKYADLSKDRTSDYVFSWDKMLAMEGNTAPYLQYAYARIRSIFRKADPGERRDAAISLSHDAELSLGKHLLRFGEIIELVARELKPHYLCTYLYEVAVKFSSFYEQCPVLQSQPQIRASRLALCELAAKTLAKGLDLLGIEHPEQM